MSNFHSPDPNLVINALRFILESYKLYRSDSGKKKEKQEEVLKKTVAKAEEMSAQGASPQTVVREIETELERDLGKQVKDEIVRRASSILALAQPFEPEAFRYYENLSQVLNRAQDFCASANVFRLRGSTNSAVSVLPMPQLNLALAEITKDFEFSCKQLERAQDVLKATATSKTYSVTKPEALHVRLAFSLTRARAVGGTFSDAMSAGLALSPGSEVNKIGFNVLTAESPFIQSFEIRLTAAEFEKIVSALLDDLNQYATELANEQRQFKEQIAPQLDSVLQAWAHSREQKAG